MAELKDQIREIVEIVSLVPDDFKAMCFELLLKDALSTNRPATTHRGAADAEQSSKTAAHGKSQRAQPELDEDASPSTSVQPKVGEGTDITSADIHMKVRKFLEKGDLTVDNLNELFYKENGGFESLVTDLGVTKMSEAQMRISLLQALHKALATGEFSTTVESVREECKMRKSYDVANFTTNIKNNAALFDFGTWTKNVTDLKLSELGKKDLATIVKNLS